MNADLIADYACKTGEGPIWHPDEQQLYWTDIPNGRLFRWDPHLGQHSAVYQGEQVGGFTVQADGALLLFKANCAVSLWRAGVETTIIAGIPNERSSRFNDVIADPVGRVFAGTMPGDGFPSRLYRIDTDGTVTQVLDDLELANGMGFTPDRTHFYFTDSRACRIYRFDYDQVTGDLTHQQLFAEVTDREVEGAPDGLTVDAEGGVWSARWGGGCVVHYAPDGSEIERLAVPTPLASCPTFGGDHFEELYVTTAGGDDRAKYGPLAGALFRLRPGVNGVPEFRSRVLDDAGL